jgi:hypothetical protein
MSSSIWTRCAGASEVRPLRLTPWRAVEAQHQISTRKLVDSRDEQELLEDLIDRVKPPIAETASRRLHYLLFTPFRYPPLPHGSRFGARHEAGIWYGSDTLPTAFAEVAYYRILFLEGSGADLGSVTTQLSAFRVSARTSRGVDLTRPPFAAHRRTIASPMSYRAAQSLGRAMRAAGVELFRYSSARDPRGGSNIGAFTPDVFGRSRPRDLQTWHCTATRERVEFSKRDYFGREQHAFSREVFLVDGVLPAPAL